MSGRGGASRTPCSLASQVQLDTPLPTGLYPALAVLLLFSGLVTTSGFAVCAILPAAELLTPDRCVSNVVHLTSLLYSHVMLRAVEVTTPRLNRSLVVETALATLSSVLLVTTYPSAFCL